MVRLVCIPKRQESSVTAKSTASLPNSTHRPLHIAGEVCYLRWPWPGDCARVEYYRLIYKVLHTYEYKNFTHTR